MQTNGSLGNSSTQHLWAKVTVSIERLRKNIIDSTLILLTISLFTTFVIVILIEINRSAILIEPFEIPKEFEKYGLTSRAVTNKFLDCINEIQKEAATTIRRKSVSPSWADISLEIELSGAGISVKSIMQYLKEHLSGPASRITGEISLSGDTIYVTSRITGGNNSTFSRSVDSLKRMALVDKLLNKSAIHILGNTQPFILASYYYEKKDTVNYMKWIKYCINNPPVNDDTWAYHLWGVVLYLSGDTTQAISKLDTAIILNPNFDLAYMNLGRFYFEGNKYDDAIKNYNKSIRINSKNSDAYYYRAQYYEKKGDKYRALHNYRKVLKYDKNPYSSFRIEAKDSLRMNKAPE